MWIRPEAPLRSPSWLPQKGLPHGGPFCFLSHRYGACGKGVAANFRNAYAVVSVVEREEAPRTADVVITVTCAQGGVTAADEPLLEDGAILANAGHFPWEIEGIVPGRVTLLGGGHIWRLRPHPRRLPRGT